MTSFDDLDRRLTARLGERASPHAPDGLSEAITDKIDGAAQRPAWATLERWIPMETRAQFGAVPRAVIVFALIAMLTLVMATAIAIGASTGPKLPDAFGPAANGLIAYVSEGDLYIVEPEGGEPNQLTSGLPNVSSPTWSRDGTRLAYWTGPDLEPRELVVIDADGNDPRVVATTVGPFNGDAIEWSADGTEIMFYEIVTEPSREPCENAGAGSACGSRMFVARTDGSGWEQVGDPELDARGPALSPDGSTVVFGGGDGADDALYVMGWDGADVEPLDTGLFTGMWAFVKQSWSPDGRTVVTKPGGETIHLVELDEDGTVEAVELIGAGIWPTFSPDGTAIESSEGRMSGTGEGRVIWELGDEVVRTHVSGMGPPAWAPDSTRLAGVRDGALVLFDRDGETLRELGPADEGPPSWQRVAE